MADKTIKISLMHYQELMEDREWLKHLKKVAHDVDESHFDECEKLNIEIAHLKQYIRNKELH